MDRITTEHFSREEVTRIIKRALRLKTRDEISHSELLEIGKELGLDTQTLEAAIEAENDNKKRLERIAAWRKSRKFEFHWHLWSYLTTSGALLLINSLIPGPWWFQWPMMGWGIGLAFHFQRVYFPNPQQIERGIRKTKGLDDPQ